MTTLDIVVYSIATYCLLGYLSFFISGVGDATRHMWIGKVLFPIRWILTPVMFIVMFSSMMAVMAGEKIDYWIDSLLNKRKRGVK